MGAVVLAAGAGGFLVRELQMALAGHGYQLVADGQYTGRTALTVGCFQRENGLPSTGETEAASWQAITGRAVPSLLERSLQLTATFESRAFGLALGDYDDGGITWGIAGFTLASGEIQRIVGDALESDERLVEAAFGPETEELRLLLSRPLPEQLRWAEEHSTGQHRITLVEPWRRHFRDLGEHPDIQALQIQRVRESCYAPAVAQARELGLSSELGVALCFDVKVQGGVAPAAASVAGGSERDRRIALAKAVAAAARPSLRNDVRARNLAIARGDGAVHGVHYVLRSWGLDEAAARLDGVACRRLTPEDARSLQTLAGC